ncbi:hypothetical protein CIPAW_16G071300 [Carya illinoinensis]|uniref:Uncharacterized protein n=1 Tax=Carya illinoinensis TaxID=32201 RepID=A0A8T1N8L0_CARIL|nr:hypothetical protein CIPAW_16G071300 [Carya illinoinensis]
MCSRLLQNSLLESNTARGVVDTLPEVDGESLQPVDEPILEVSLSGKEKNNAYDTKKRPKGGKVTRLRSSTRS